MIAIDSHDDSSDIDNSHDIDNSEISMIVMIDSHDSNDDDSHEIDVSHDIDSYIEIMLDR